MATRPTQEPSGSSRSGLTPVSLFMVLLLFWILTQAQLVLVLALLALLLGTILERPVQFFQERRFPRPAAILAVYVIIIGGLALLIVAIVPSISDQVSEFTEDFPTQLRELREDWSESDNTLLSGPGVGVLNRAIDTVDGGGDVSVSPDALDRAIPVVTGITGGVVSAITLLVMTFYYLLEKRLLRGLILDTLTPRFRARVDGLWTEVENKVGGWMRGQLMLVLIIGTIATIAYGIIGLEFWPLLGLWAGLTEIIPIIGPWIGGVPAVLIALTVSWEVALITILVIVGMQSLENWVLVPRVMKGAVGLTPLTVFVAILAGTQVMGIVGAVLAIPIAATIQVILTDFLERRHSRDERMTARSGWRWMLSRSGLRDAESEDSTDVAVDAPAGSRATTAADRDDEAFTAQQESESFAAQQYQGDGNDNVAEDDYDEAEPVDIDGDVGTEDRDPEPEGEIPPCDEPEEGQREAPSSEDEGLDDAPSYAAWPRASDKPKKTGPSSTWPPLEQGRPSRNRRRDEDS